MRLRDDDVGVEGMDALDGVFGCSDERIRRLG